MNDPTTDQMNDPLPLPALARADSPTSRAVLAGVVLPPVSLPPESASNAAPAAAAAADSDDEEAMVAGCSGLGPPAAPDPDGAPRVDEAALRDAPLPHGSEGLRVRRNRELAAKLRPVLLAERVRILEVARAEHEHFTCDFTKRTIPLPDEADKYHKYYPEAAFATLGAGGSAYYRRLNTQPGRGGAGARIRKKGKSRRPGAKVRPMRGYGRRWPQAAVDMLHHAGGPAGWLMHNTDAGNPDVAPPYDQPTMRALQHELVFPARNAVEADWVAPPYHPHEQLTLSELLDRDSGEITYEEWINAQAFESQHVLMGGCNRDYQTVGDIELKTLDYCIAHLEMLLNRVPHRTETMALQPMQQLAAGLMVDPAINQDMFCEVRDLTKSLDPWKADYADSFQQTLPAGEAMRIRFCRLGTGLGKTLMVTLSIMSWVCDAARYRDIKNNYAKILRKNATNGLTGAVEGPAAGKADRIKLARLVLFTPPPLMKQHWLEHAREVQYAIEHHMGIRFEIWDGFTSTHDGCCDRDGVKLRPSLRAAATAAANTPIAWILPADGKTLRKAHYEDGACEVGYMARIVDEGIVAADTCGREFRNPWRVDPLVVEVAGANMDEHETLTQNQPRAPPREAMTGLGEDSNSLGFCMSAPRHLTFVALACTPNWLQLLVGKGARLNMPKSIIRVTLYLRFTALTAQGTSASVVPAPLDDFLHALFSTAGVQSEDGTEQVVLTHAQRAPMVLKAKRIICNDPTADELRQMEIDPNSQLGRGAKLMALKATTEERLAELTAEHHAAWRAGHHSGALDLDPPADLPPSLEMRQHEAFISALDKLQSFVNGEDGRGQVDAESGHHIEEPFVTYMTCCGRWKDRRDLEQLITAPEAAHSATITCPLCSRELDKSRIVSAHEALEAIERAPEEKKRRKEARLAVKEQCTRARQKRETVLRCKIEPHEQPVLGNNAWLVGRLNELLVVDLVEPLDYVGAALKLILNYKPNAKIIFGYHVELTGGGPLSRDQLADTVNNNLANEMKRRVPELEHIVGMRPTGKQKELAAYRATSDMPSVLLCNLVKHCRPAFFGLDLAMTDAIVFQAMTGRVASSDTRQLLGRFMRNCGKADAQAGESTIDEQIMALLDTAVSSIASKICIDLRAKQAHGGGADSTLSERHSAVLRGRELPTAANQNPNTAATVGQHDGVHSADENDDDAEFDEAMAME